MTTQILQRPADLPPPGRCRLGVGGGGRVRLPKVGAMVPRPWIPLRAEAGTFRGGDGGRRVWWWWPLATSPGSWRGTRWCGGSWRGERAAAGSGSGGKVHGREAAD